MKYSGLQKEVLKLYRSCIRQAYKKPTENQDHWVRFVHEQFDKYRAIPKRDFATIEHLLRTGHRRLEMYSNDNITDVH
ncbi:Succinate dehydrogenase assembly factor [Komagataella phaffii CBS 7435]|uniref:Complex 1 LYR protein domain-containing protein n=2 Tax=Komagataella phaffii TaxID=460519 RepID=C4QVE6_KOMPG|nr:Hypothetical protein identified by homology [Komagataella phaffii GS115]CAH2445875.1 Succinate dehydrogenase assembly factor [Komagataella phaffii CBS 7435]CAY67219.1 Hypothetical protein identified by homology [Komagataella phaffii GS115]SCV11767.1 Succinate dehydrogenase assembly factor [Komagataella phaffii CBS 7435]